MMSTFLTDVRQILVPHADEKYGPLPPLLLAMTVVTGLVDAFSYLQLGHVFVANMTGNVVFLAFALAGASGFSIAASLLALAAFALGGFGGGLLASHLGQRKGHILSVGATLQTGLLVIAAVLTVVAGKPVPTIYSYILIIVLGLAMGLQNAVARKLAVPDLTTTVLTLTIVGIAADSRLAGGSGSKIGRRLLSVLAMFVGALIGSLIVFHTSIVYVLVLAVIILAVVAATVYSAARTNPAWNNPS